MSAEEKHGVLLLTLREYPGEHRPSTLAVDPVSGALTVGTTRVKQNGLQKALRAQRDHPEATADPHGDEGLLKKRVKKLEKELRKLVSTSRMPPSARRQFLESYALNTQLADAAERVRAQRTFLENSVEAYRRPEMQLSAMEQWSEWDLEALALTMPIKAGSYLGEDREKRQAALDNILSQYEQETFAAEDREFHRRLALASVIKDNADDSAYMDSNAAGKTIEDLSAHELCCPSCGAHDVQKDVTALQSGNSGGWTDFKCRKCGHHEDGLDGDMKACRSPWLRTRKTPLAKILES